MDLDHAAVERVLRRASELSAAHVDPDAISAATTDELLVSAASEVGIAPEAVRLSLAIERLVPAPPPTRYDWLVGPGWVVTQRIVPADQSVTMARLDDRLRRKHGLRRIRTQQAHGEWSRRKGAFAHLYRAVKQISGEQGVSDADRIVADTRSADLDRTVVRVALDRRSQRTGRFTGGAIVTSLGAAGLAVATTAIGPLVLLASPAVLVAGTATMRRGVRQAASAEVELERMLDGVERGTPSRTRSRSRADL